MPEPLLRRVLRPFLSRRFLKFCAVGASGVGVNLGTLWLVRHFGVRANLASLAAIEVSLLSNFFINYAWTFRDRRAAGDSLWSQGVRFHLVSLFGAGVQFVIFSAMNMVWLVTLFDTPTLTAYQSLAATWKERWLVHPFVDPPDVGGWLYVSQLAGIGAATIWNYLLNFYWTWSEGKRDGR